MNRVFLRSATKPFSSARWLRLHPVGTRRVYSTTFTNENTIAPPTMEDVFNETPPFMSFYQKLGIFSTIVAYYRSDSQKFFNLIHDISSTSPAAVKGGLNSLDQVLFHKQRTFGGVTTIKAGQEELVSNGLIEALLRAVSRQNVSINDRMKALEVLAHLVKVSATARQRVTKDDMQPLANVLDNLSLGESNERAAMLAGATILMTLMDQDCRDAVRSSSAVTEAIANLTSKSGSALQSMMAQELSAAMASIAVVDSGDGISEEQSVAMQAALSVLLPPKRQNNEEMYGKLFDALGIGAFGFVYGRARWFLRAYTAGTKLPMRTVALSVAKGSRVGVWMFSILMVDAAFSLLCRDWQAVRDDVKAIGRDVDALSLWQPVADAPPRLVLPSLSAAICSGLCVAAIRRQRFMLLPISAALAQSHWDVVTHSMPYQWLDERMK